jgi:transposase
VVCDAAYSSAAWFALVMEAGALPVVRFNPTHPKAKHFDRAAYRRRHRVENCWARLKEWRAVPTRYDKTAASVSGGHLAAAFEWLPNGPKEHEVEAARERAALTQGGEHLEAEACLG